MERKIAMPYTDWETPQAFFASLDAEFHFDLDVCAEQRTAKCDTYLTREDNGLAMDWGNYTCWMNPPYGKDLGKWLRKAYEASRYGATVVALIPGNISEQDIWHDVILQAHEIRYIQGRLHFLRDGVASRSNHPSVIVVFRPGQVEEPYVSSISSETFSTPAGGINKGGALGWSAGEGNLPRPED